MSHSFQPETPPLTPPGSDIDFHALRATRAQQERERGALSHNDVAPPRARRSR